MRNFTSFWILFLGPILLTSSLSFARVKDFQTTRLKATAGAGVGSILMNESAILNPAPVAFFNNSSVYLQTQEYLYEGAELQASGVEGQYNQNSDTRGVIVADTKNQLKGAASYTKQQEGYDIRKRITAALAAPISARSALGFLYRKTEDTNYDFITTDGIEDSYDQLVVGATHAVDEDFTLGAIVVDPFKTKPEDTRAILGTQFIFKRLLTIMIDLGADYTQDLAETRQYRVATQINAFSDIYLRFGVFEDRALDEKGNGIGVAWVGPKLVIEASIQNIKDLGLRPNDVPTPSKLTETSFAMSYFF